VLTLLIPSWHLSSVYARGSGLIFRLAIITPSGVVPHPLLDPMH